MLDDHQIVKEDQRRSSEGSMEFLRKERFFSLITFKEYHGREFSLTRKLNDCY